MKAALIINKKAGTFLEEKDNISEKQIESLFKENGIDVHIYKIDGGLISQKTKSILKSDFDIIIAAGGDGTISTVASRLINADIPLGIIPLGTLNHFAKDLNIPLNLEDAIKVIGENNIIKVDMGSVNDRFFINNSSVGIYPKVVRKRDKHFQRLGGRKWIAMIYAFINTFKKLPLLDVKINSKAEKIYCTTPFVFIGNNKYEMNLFKLGSRDKLNEGRLSLYYPTCSGKYDMIKFAFLALINRLDQEKNFKVTYTDQITLEANKKILEVAADGEVFTMNTPLYYKIIPKSLKVLVPKE